jgi:hypothetical protein
VPEVLAGRAEQLDRHEAALLHGPRDPLFTQAVIGERGVGKTVFLSVLASRMQDKHDWITLLYQARTGVYATAELLEELPDAVGRSWRGRGLRDLQRELSIEVNAAVVKVQGRVTASPHDSRHSPALALARAVRTAGSRSAKHGRGLLLAIDEAHTLTAESLADLGMIAQTVSHREGHPVAITLAGTPELAAILLRSGTFLERMARTELRMLNQDETARALLEPASAHGLTWDPNALGLVCQAAGGYPYFVQLGGYCAWEHTDTTRITLEAAAQAAQEIHVHAERIFHDRWQRLGPAQRKYLATVAIAQLQSGARTARTGEIAKMLEKEHTELSRVRSTLINEHGLLRPAQRGEIEFAIPRFGEWLQEKLAPGRPSASGDPDPEFAGYLPPPIHPDAQSVSQPRALGSGQPSAERDHRKRLTPPRSPDRER